MFKFKKSVILFAGITHAFTSLFFCLFFARNGVSWVYDLLQALHVGDFFEIGEGSILLWYGILVYSFFICILLSFFAKKIQWILPLWVALLVSFSLTIVYLNFINQYRNAEWLWIYRIPTLVFLLLAVYTVCFTINLIRTKE